MTAQDIAAHDVISFDDLKRLAGAKGPCLTMVVPLPNPLEIEARLKNAIRAARKAVADDAFPEPIRNLADTVETDRNWASALIVLRSPDVFRYYWLRGQWKETASVADRFQAWPLFAVMAREQRFHLLALSQKHIRLFHCTQHKAEEARLRGLVPENFQVWLNTRQPDHDLQNRQSGISSTGSMKGVVFGTSTDREREEESLRHFLKEADKGVSQILRTDTAPLLLAGVD